MFRILFIAFFMATSVMLYLGGREGPASDQAVSSLNITHHVAAVPEPVKVRTVSKRFEKVNVGRRFTDKADIEEELQRKHQKNVQPVYPIFMVDKPKKQALTSQNKYRIAIKMKSELKRIGCFRGAISGSWDGDVYKALSHFNASTGQSLDTDKPSLTSLTALEGHYLRACRSKYRVAQRQLHLTVAHLPIRKPVSLIQAQSLAVPALSEFPAKRTAAAEVTPAQQMPLVPKLTKKSKKKRKVRRIASFEETFQAAQHQSYYGYSTRRRPAASYVGRRIKKSPKAKRKSRRARARARARLHSARKHRAKKRRAKRHRRRYRRYRRRRFGFSHNGELGFF